MPETGRIFSADKVVMGILAAAAAIVVAQYYSLSGRVGELTVRVAEMRAAQETVAAQLVILIDKGSVASQRTEATINQLADRLRQQEMALTMVEHQIRTELVALENRVYQRIDKCDQEFRMQAQKGNR